MAPFISILFWFFDGGMRASRIVIVLLSSFVLSGNLLAAPRLNVLFLAVDDMRDWVGCLGGYPGKVHTPHIDRLADEGMLFTNAHCPSPKCAPSRASIMTGLRPSTTGLYDNGHWWFPNLEGRATLPTHFRKQGYHVVGAGKIFHHTAGNNPPNQWDEFLPLRFRDDPWFRDAKINYPWSESGPFPPGFPFSGVDGLGHENDWGSPLSENQIADDDRTVGFIVDYLSKEHGAPFFAACGIFRPHLPWYVPQEFFELYPIEEIIVPESPRDDLDDVPEGGRKLAKAGRRDLDAIREAGRIPEAVRAYLASISYADHQVGRVLDALKQSRYSENTIVVFWSDHGWHLGEKQHWHKSTLWEEATRIPFVVDVPGLSAGICDQPVNLLSIFPTLIELCELAEVEKMDGVSLKPLLLAPNAFWEHPSVVEYGEGNIAIRTRDHRFIRYRDGGEELYDHRTDPKEWNNLAGKAEYQGRMESFQKWLPKNWARSAPTKKAFEFDPETFRWKVKESGRWIDGNKPTN